MVSAASILRGRAGEVLANRRSPGFKEDGWGAILLKLQGADREPVAARESDALLHGVTTRCRF